MGTTRCAMRVLFATDGSEAAEAAAKWLSVFPMPSNARALVLAVQELPPSPLDIPTVRDFQRALLDEARHTAGRAAATLRERFGTIETKVVTGEPREKILDVAAEWDADLIAVGARGLGALASALLGSVSLAIARHAPCPVLVVRPAVRRPLHSIVVAFDGSAGAQHAARFVAALALPTEVGVRLVGVVEPPRTPVAGPGATAMLAAAAEKVTAARRGELEKAMDTVSAQLEGLNAAHVLAVGPPADTLARLDADLIVLGARGLGTVKRLLVGSVSEHVLRHAHCPVLIVRGSLLERIARRRRRRARASASS
jgi:nucleotide-binding universal stress UspA family protein